jgi:hypothetical protein
MTRLVRPLPRRGKRRSGRPRDTICRVAAESSNPRACELPFGLELFVRLASGALRTACETDLGSRLRSTQEALQSPEMREQIVPRPGLRQSREILS